MSNIEYVVRHGKRIATTVLDPPKSARRPRSDIHEPFAKVYLKDAAAVAEAFDSPIVLIWPLLIHLAWKAKSTTFPVSNQLLARYGIDRWTKYRVLKHLKKVGRIGVRTEPGKAMLVTLLVASEGLSPAP